MTDSFCSTLKRFLRCVVGSKTGICTREIELVDVSTGKPPSEKKSNIVINDRFKLKIPITDQFMTWEVIFNCSLPHCPPDFELNDIDFFYSLNVDTAEELLPSLRDWDYRKEKALINVISELRSAYLRYQVERLEHVDNRCAYEYSTLIRDGRVHPEHVEVLTDDTAVHFFIKLDVNLTFMPSTEDCFIVLGVKYGTLSSSCDAKLYTSMKVNRSLGISLDLPHNLKSDENLSDYAEEVVRSIEHQIETVFLTRQKRRRNFIFCLLKELGSSVISYDALEYKSASFLLEKDGFICIMEVKLPEMFPNQGPCWRLLSTYSTADNGQPFSQVLSPPFSNSWETALIVEQSLNFIFKKIKQFRACALSVFELPK